ncbi:MAG: MopE-related protein [archaeon]
MKSKLIILAAMMILLGSIVYAEGNSTNVTIQNVSSNLNLIAPIFAHVNSTIGVQANYTYVNGTIAGIDVCRYEGISMGFNLSSGLYFTQKVYSQIGNFSYLVNCYMQGFENLTKTGMIEIKLLNLTNSSQNITVDNDHDGFSSLVDCNDSNPNINPGKEEILYNLIDDDCNPATLDYLNFNVTVNKGVYSPQETVSILINARNGSDTYITINTPTNVSYVYIFSNGSYPVTQQFSLTSMSGDYSVEAANYFGEYVRNDEVHFSVSGTMNAQIETDKSDAFTGENIHFKAVITGAVGQVNMIWDMDNTQQRYSSEFDFNYSAARSYNVILIATDQGGNQVIISKPLLIKNKFLMSFTVVDNVTSEIIPNATIELDGVKKEVNSSGQAEFIITNRTYEVRVKAVDYLTFREDIKLNGSLIFTVRLSKNAIDMTPIVSLIYPVDNAAGNGEFRFRLSDNGNSVCTLYLSDGNGWWAEANSSSVPANSDFTFYHNLEDSYTYWKVQCRDADGNTGSSADYKFTLPAQTELSDETEAISTYNVVQNVYDVLPNFEQYGPDERKIVEYLQLEVLLKDAKRRLEMANRDLFNLRLEPDTESVLSRRNEIYATIDKIKDETPSSVTSKKKVEFVKYLEDTELEELFSEYIGLKRLELKNAEKKALLEQNKLLQKKLTVETSAYNAEIQFISGRKEDATIVARQINFDGDRSGIKYAEFLPKIIVEKASDINFVNKPDTILQDDPVFEKDLSSTEMMVYYIKKSVSLEEIPKIKSAIFTLVPADGKSSITGFAVLDSLGFSDSNKKLFLVQLAIVFMLLGIYLFFHFRNGPSESDEQVFDITSPAIPMAETRLAEANGFSDAEKVAYMKSLIMKTNGLISKNLEDAALKYHELRFLYDMLSDNDKEYVHREISLLGDEISSRYLDSLINLAIVQLAHGNHDAASQVYEEMMLEFNKLSDDYKDRVYSRCCEVALHLKNG